MKVLFYRWKEKEVGGRHKRKSSLTLEKERKARIME
jgi:hypothetical protein